MSVIVNIGVLMWIVVISFLVGMTVGIVIMVHAFYKDKKSESSDNPQTFECENNKKL